MGRFQRSVGLAKASWSVLKSEKQLAWLPVLSFIGSVVVMALFGLAIWDALGKATGQPVFKLLGGRTKAGIPVYASRLYSQPLDELAAEASKYKEAGYRAMEAGRALVIPGLANRMLALSVRLSPRWAVRKVAGWLNQKRRTEKVAGAS